MLNYINDNIISIIAKTRWDRNIDTRSEDYWFTDSWDGHVDIWKEEYKKNIRSLIQNLNVKFLKKWVEKGIHSDELIAKTILLALDARDYKIKQTQLIEQISDKNLRESVIKSLDINSWNIHYIH